MPVVHLGNVKKNFHVAFDLTGVPTTNAFIGRRSDLDLIKEQLMPGEVPKRQKVCVIHGLGGMGKTQLAIEYARKYKSAYTSFFWLDGKTEESLIKSLIGIVSRLPKGQVSAIDAQNIGGLEESRKIAQEVLQWFYLEGNTQWLLLFDNIDETSYEESDQHIRSSSYNIKDYFPGGDTGAIIITTRLQRLVNLGSSIGLRKLTLVDGLLVLEKYARRSLRRAGGFTTLSDVSGTEGWDLGKFLTIQLFPKSC